MSPDEWKAGMENEAASVSDAAWAQNTRAAARPSLWPLLGWVLGLSALKLGLMAGLNAVFVGYAPALLPWAMQASQHSLNPVWLVPLTAAFVLTRLGRPAIQTYAMLAGSFALTATLPLLLNPAVPVPLAGVSGASIDLLPSAQGISLGTVLSAVALHLAFATAGLLLGRWAHHRAVGA